jgi:hypothetical protein
METKQTAVDYIVNVVNSCIAPDYIPNEIVKQAKAMEKDQIRDAFTDGCIGELYELNAYYTSEKYYNETYGKDNEQN